MSIKSVTEIDIVIIGGGIAGCTAAIALSKNYTVALIDKELQPVDRIGECLPPAARRILKQLDLLEGLENEVYIANKQVQQKNTGTQSYWGSETSTIVDHLRNPDGFGWQLNRKEFELYLRTSAQQRGVHCLFGYKLHEATYDTNHWTICIKDSDALLEPATETISAKFVIDASGRQSHFARTLDIKRESLDKLIATWAIVVNHETITMSTISSCEQGWWYSAPLPNNKRVIAFQTDSDLIERTQIKTADSFLQLAKGNKQMASILAKNKQPIQFQGTVAANSTRLHQVVGKQWAALGDAALSFDPLSSQGMFNAMASALQLTELLQKHQIIALSDKKQEAAFQADYTQQINHIWEYYLKHKTLFYSHERRWCQSEFWRRRQ
ncbi:MAG: FAD-dependent oxidoreductase [Flavobacterium sp.]|uniref:NAD(P)/FAD-dependent oxidoreductase n=1 Tax=Flavobacterium sp. TaxID=239 RepID=UPI003267A08B